MAEQKDEMMKSQIEDKNSLAQVPQEKVELWTEPESESGQMDQDIEYPTGLRLTLVILPLVTVAYLIFLDSSIIVTVC
jgi:hypothetical protein